MTFANFLQIAEILVALLLILVILLQAKGSGFGSALGGPGSTVFRTRRGVEKTLFQFTIFLGVLFILLAMGSVIVT
jgi:preprotein translocase subunit SecG